MPETRWKPSETCGSGFGRILTRTHLVLWVKKSKTYQQGLEMLEWNLILCRRIHLTFRSLKWISQLVELICFQTCEQIECISGHFDDGQILCASLKLCSWTQENQPYTVMIGCFCQGKRGCLPSSISARFRKDRAVLTSVQGFKRDRYRIPIRINSAQTGISKWQDLGLGDRNWSLFHWGF